MTFFFGLVFLTISPILAIWLAVVASFTYGTAGALFSGFVLYLIFSSCYLSLVSMAALDEIGFLHLLPKSIQDFMDGVLQCLNILATLVGLVITGYLVLEFLVRFGLSFHLLLLFPGILIWGAIFASIFLCSRLEEYLREKYPDKELSPEEKAKLTALETTLFWLRLLFE